MRRDYDNEPQSAGGVANDTITLRALGDGPVPVPDAALLFHARFQRDGDDLLLVNDGAADIRIVDYFMGDPADLAVPGGARLTGDSVLRLAGPMAPGQYAQVGQPDLGASIGQVETLEGRASVQRVDGTVEALAVGTQVYQDDVVSTEDDGALALTFVDGTMFTLAADSRMVLDELIYSPGGSGNSAVFDLVEGGFVFVAGQVARTGDMEVATPSATMGIRGTTVLVEIASSQGNVTVSVSLTEDFDGSGVGAIELRNLDGTLIANITSTSDTWVVPTGQGAFSVPRSAADDADDAAILTDAAAAFVSAQARVAAGQDFVDGGTSAGAAQTGDPAADPDAGDSDGDGGDGDGGDGTGSGTGGGLAPDDPGTGGAVDPLDDGGDGSEQGADDTGPAPTDISAPPAGPAGGPPVVVETNAAPIAQPGTVTVAEDGSISGTLSASDVNGDALRFSIATAPANGVVAVTGDGNFTYLPDADFNGTDQFSFSVSDGAGGRDTETVAVTVTPVNDAPRITSDDTDAAGTVTEAESDGTGAIADAGVPEASGTLSAVDIDAGATVTWSGSAKGVYGQFTIDPDTGAWTYRLDNDRAATEALDAGDTVTESFEARATDEVGAETPATVTVAIAGTTDDAPVVTAVTEGAVTEGDPGEAATATGTLAIADVDADDAPVFADVAPRPGDAGLGAFALAAGTWTYTLDQGAVQALDAGDSVTDTTTFTASDGTPVTVTVAIAGTDDAPVLTAVTEGAVTEGDPGEAATATGTLAIADVDADDAPVFADVAPRPGDAGLGAFALAAGTWTYTLDQGAVQALDAGDSVTDTTTFTASDGTPVTVTVAIAGTDDAPVVTDVYAERVDPGIVTGTIPATDVENDTLTFTLADGPTQGAVTISGNGDFTYLADESASGFDRFTVDVSDGTSITTATVTIGIENDGGERAEARNLTLDYITDAGPEGSANSIRIGRSDVTATPINIAFAMDASGSFSDEFTTQINAVEGAIDTLRTLFGGSSTDVDINLIRFASSVTSSASFDLQDDEAAISDYLQAIRDQGASGGTNWSGALSAANTFFTGENTTIDEDDYLYFITDGQPSFRQGANDNDALADLRDAHPDVDILTFAIGAFSGTGLLTTNYGTATDPILFDSDGVADPLAAASDLVDALAATPLFAAELASLSVALTADGVDQGEIASAASDALQVDALDIVLPLSLVDGLEDRLGATNDIQTTAVFDLDGDAATTADQVTLVETTQILRPDNAVTLSGTSGETADALTNDLLLGSTEADSLSGLDGHDLLSGGGGADTLLGGDGDDTLAFDGPILGDTGGVADGGAGRDVLAFTMAGDLMADVLPTLSITDIEAIDMENGHGDNALSLSLSDLQDLSPGPDEDLEALISGAEMSPSSAQSATVYGDSGDTLDLDAEGGTIRANGSVTDDQGRVLELYEFVDGADAVVGLLAVDDDIVVTGAGLNTVA